LILQRVRRVHLRCLDYPALSRHDTSRLRN